MQDKVPADKTDLRKYQAGTVVIRKGGVEGFILAVDSTNITYPVRVRFPDYEDTYTSTGKRHIGHNGPTDVEYVLEFKVVEVPKPKQDPHLDSRDFFVKTLGGIL
jgi:hypothetical protein